MRKIFLFLFIFTTSCSDFNRPKSFPIYGKYCGKETIIASMLQQNPPEMVIDFLCSERLVCIARNGVKNIRNCNIIFISELKKLDIENSQEKRLVEAMIKFLN